MQTCDMSFCDYPLSLQSIESYTDDHQRFDRKLNSQQFESIVPLTTQVKIKVSKCRNTQSSYQMTLLCCTMIVIIRIAFTISLRLEYLTKQLTKLRHTSSTVEYCPLYLDKISVVIVNTTSTLQLIVVLLDNYLPFP